MRRPYFSTFELLLLALFATLVVVGNIALRLPVKMPGHSGVVWMALLVTTTTRLNRIIGVQEKMGAQKQTHGRRFFGLRPQNDKTRDGY